MDVASQQIDALIGRRSRMEEQTTAEEMAWKASVRAYNAQRAEERREQWRSFHERMAAVHEDLARGHQEQVETLGGDLETANGP